MCKFFLAGFAALCKLLRNAIPTMKIIIEIDTETDLKPQELELLRANALLANRTEAEQLKIILLGEPQPTQADAA